MDLSGEGARSGLFFFCGLFFFLFKSSVGNLTIFAVVVRLVPERVEVVVLVRRADRLKAVVAVAVFAGVLVRLLRLALVRARPRQTAVLAGLLPLLLFRLGP